ncbi:hypothetical protein MPSEU_000921100 [Mayamaea pseudoterrestris]|nr:hypothetical protein MPSEU_000921100 [Mayamaea pseudoterrestris]
MASTVKSSSASTSSPTSNDTATTPNNPYLIASYVTIACLWIVSQYILIPYVVHVLLLTTAILYAACHASLVLRESATTNNDGSSEKETMRLEDAYQFPLVGSASLFGLYLAFKFLNKAMVNKIIGAYFGVAGCLAMTMTMSPAIAKLTPQAMRKHYGVDKKFAHPVPMLLESPIHFQLDFTGNDALAFMISVAICVTYFTSKPWYLNNLMGISFCLQGVSKFSLGTYKIGAILLVGLFFYDIFWVFGTEVMVSVAKSLDGPIKILFPRSLTRNAETNLLDMSLLGLGDIVIPGFFLALMLRFDAHRAGVSVVPPVNVHADFDKPYFHATLAAYFCGLGLTMFVMLTFNAAQPALLYLVPACLCSSMGLALWRGEVAALLEYSEEEEEEQVDAAGEKESKKIN